MARLLRRKSLLLLIIASFASIGAAKGADKPKLGTRYIELYTGVKHVERLPHLPPGVETYGDFEQIGEIRPIEDTNSIEILPKKEGLATLNIHDSRGFKLYEIRLDSRPSKLSKVVREVRALLSNIDGITVKIVNNKVIIDGSVLLPRDLNRILGVIQQYPKGTVSHLVEINPFAQTKIASLIERDINNPDIEVRSINGKFFLKGVVNSETEKTTAQIIAESYLPPPVINTAEESGSVKKKKDDNPIINLISIRSGGPPPPLKTIQVVVHYVELSKSYLRSSSFQFAPTLDDGSGIEFSSGNDSTLGGIVSTFTGVVRRLLPKLNYAKSHGFGRVLKSTSIVVEEGERGQITQGTRVPFLQQASGAFAPTTQFEDINITCAVTPTIPNPRSDQIKLDLDFQVKELVGTTPAGPQTSNNNLKTKISVRSGQSAAIGGLIGNNTSTTFNPDNDSEAIINLNASKRFQKNRNQYVVFVTPIIKSSASAGSEKIKAKFRLRE